MSGCRSKYQTQMAKVCFYTDGIETNTYKCNFCGFAEGWDDTDEIHGDMFGCEKCGKAFCAKCFKDRLGENEYYRRMQGFDLILCPDCYEKEMI